MSSTTVSGTSSVGYNNVADMMVGFHGGLDTNTDPFVLPAPVTTTATDMLYYSPGQVQALPLAARAFSDTDTSGTVLNTYGGGPLPAFDPFTTTSTYEFAEVARVYTDGNGSSTISARTSPYMLVRDYNGNDPKGSFNPIYPYLTSTRSAVGALGIDNYLDNSTGQYNASGPQEPNRAGTVQTVSAAHSWGTKNAPNNTQVVTATLAYTSGYVRYQVNLTDAVGSTTAQQTVSGQIIASGSAQAVVRLVADPSVANQFFLLIGVQDEFGVHILQINTPSTTDVGSTTALTVNSSNINAVQLFDATYINGLPYLLYYQVGGGTSAAIVAHALSGSVADQTWPITVPAGASTVTSIAVASVVTQDTTNSNFAVMVGVDLNLYTIVVNNVQAYVSSTALAITHIPQTIGCRPSATTLTQPIGACFGHQVETFTGLTAYGWTTDTQYVQQVVATYFNNKTGTTFIEKNSYFRTIQGATICAKVYSTTVRAQDSTGATQILGNPGDSFLCPIFLGSTFFDAAANMGTADQCGYVLDQFCRVASRFSDQIAPFAVYNNSIVGTDPVNFCRASTLSEQLFFRTPNDSALFEFGFPFPQPVILGITTPETEPPAPGSSFAARTVPIQEGGFISFFIMKQSPQGVLPTAVQKGKSILVTGGLAMEYDTRTLHESGFHQPAQLISPGVVITGTSIPSSAMTFVMIYTWVDATGQRHQSNVSLPRLITPVLTGSAGIKFFLPAPQATFKGQNYPGDVPVYAEVFCNSPQLKDATLYYTGTVSMPNGNNDPIGSGILSLGASWTYTNDPTVFDSAYSMPYAGGVASNINEYSSDPPPPFLSTCNSQGRAMGLACVGGSYRVYFTSLFSDNFNQTVVGQTPRWNGSGYLTAPRELGDVRSIAAMDDKIVLFGTLGIGVFNGQGPTSLQLPSQRPVFTNQTDTQFSVISPIAGIAGGIRGYGSVYSFSGGILFQDSEGMKILGRGLATSFPGKAICEITNATTYGVPFLSQPLQIIVIPNATGPSLAFEYTSQIFSQWKSIGNCFSYYNNTVNTGFVTNGSVDTTLCNINNTFTSKIYPTGQTTPVTPNANSNMVMETPWIPMGQGVSGEGGMWDMVLLGKYYQPHTLLVETAFNYGAYSQTTIFQPGIDPTLATLPYQYRCRPLQHVRMQSVRYRITITNAATGPTSCECARITGIMLYGANYRGLQRVGAAVSK